MLNDGLFIYLNLHEKYTCSNTNRREDLESCWPGRSCSCRNNKVKRCRFVEVKNGLSLSQIVAFFPSGSVGCRCSGTRVSRHFLQFWSDVACRQEPLEGLVNTTYIFDMMVNKVP